MKLNNFYPPTIQLMCKDISKQLIDSVVYYSEHIEDYNYEEKKRILDLLVDLFEIKKWMYEYGHMEDDIKEIITLENRVNTFLLQRKNHI